MSKFETLEAYALGTIGLIRGLGEIATQAIIDKINPWKVDYDIGEYIAEISREYAQEDL